MMRNFLLLLIDTVIVLVEGSITGIMLVKDYGVRMWKNNVVRKWVFEIMDRADTRFREFERYLEAIETRLRCRIVYARISQPMRNYYRELTGRRFL